MISSEFIKAVSISPNISRNETPATITEVNAGIKMEALNKFLPLTTFAFKKNGKHNRNGDQQQNRKHRV